VGAVIPTRSAGASNRAGSTISSVCETWCSRGVSAAINGMVSWGNWISRPRRSRRDAGDSAVIRWTRIGPIVQEGRSRLLFAALLVDDGLEGFGRERAPDDAVADHEARSRVESERGRESHIFAQGLLGRGRHHVRLEPGGVEAARLADGQDALDREVSLEREHGAMELRPSSLLLGGDGSSGREDRGLAQYREILVDDTHRGVGGHEAIDRGRDVAAVDTPIVEELDDGDGALRVALDGRGRIREERLLVVADSLLRLGRGRRRLALLQPAERLREHFGLSQQVVAHDLLDLLLGEHLLVRGDRAGESR